MDEKSNERGMCSREGTRQSRGKSASLDGHPVENDPCSRPRTQPSQAADYIGVRTVGRWDERERIVVRSSRLPTELIGCSSERARTREGATERVESEGGTESSDRGCRGSDREGYRARTNEAASERETVGQRDRIRGRRRNLCLAAVRGLEREKRRRERERERESVAKGTSE